MPHGYLLHRPVTATCTCCRTTYMATFTATSDHVLCGTCRRHLGKPERLQADHLAMWQALLEQHQEKYERRVETALAQAGAYREERDRVLSENEDLRAVIRSEYTQALPEHVRAALITDEVVEAREVRDRALRSRDRAYRALVAVDQIHHGDQSRLGQCTCGKVQRECRERAAILEVEEALYRWERKQIENLKSGRWHSLPDDHQEVLSSSNRRGRA